MAAGSQVPAAFAARMLADVTGDTSFVVADATSAALCPDIRSLEVDQIAKLENEASSSAAAAFVAEISSVARASAVYASSPARAFASGAPRHLGVAVAALVPSAACAKQTVTWVPDR